MRITKEIFGESPQRRWKVRVLFEPRDIWIGIYWTPVAAPLTLETGFDIFICIIPLLPVKISFRSYDPGYPKRGYLAPIRVDVPMPEVKPPREFKQERTGAPWPHSWDCICGDCQDARVRARAAQANPPPAPRGGPAAVPKPIPPPTPGTRL